MEADSITGLCREEDVLCSELSLGLVQLLRAPEAGWQEDVPASAHSPLAILPPFHKSKATRKA